MIKDARDFVYGIFGHGEVTLNCCFLRKSLFNLNEKNTK
jgi:hypothetical protein